MVAIFTWFTTFFLQAAASQIARKALMVISFNIALGFIVAWIGNHGIAGLTFLGMGETVTSSLQALAPRIGFYWNYFKCSFGVFLILNALLLRFTFNISLAALGASR